MAADTKLKITAGFEFTMNEKRQVQDAAKALIGERRKFGELWRDFLDGDADAEQLFVWWWAKDNDPDLKVEDVGDWGPNDYEVVVPEGEESEGEGNAAASGGSTTSMSSGRSSSSTRSARMKSADGTATG